MPTPLTKLPTPGGGPLGFGCGFLLVGAMAFLWTERWFPLEMRNTLLVVLAIAVVGGLLAARFGDEFFDRLL